MDVSLKKKMRLCWIMMAGFVAISAAFAIFTYLTGEASPNREKLLWFLAILGAGGVGFSFLVMLTIRFETWATSRLEELEKRHNVPKQ